MAGQVLWLVILLTTVFDLPSFKSQDLLALRTYCGLQHADDYVRDNDNITLDEFPWIAQILIYKNSHVKCVGSLINRRYVLTSGDCIQPQSAPITGVRFGDYDVTTDRDCTNHTKFGEECSDPVQEFDVEELILHEDYNFTTSENDIGLIRLSRNVDYSDYVRPICLPSPNSSELEEGEQLAVSGFGDVGFGERSTKIKKKISASLASLEKCRTFYKDFLNSPITSKQLCVIEDEESFTCQGDGGSPLIKSTRHQWYQVGLVSYGYACGYGFPSVYTKLSSYLEWIKKHLRK